MAGRIVVVTGASRGLGQGIALALGATGDTVYVTGRSDGRSTSQAWPGTVQATAEEITARGGTGRPEAAAAWCTRARANSASKAPSSLRSAAASSIANSICASARLTG